MKVTNRIAFRPIKGKSRKAQKDREHNDTLYVTFVVEEMKKVKIAPKGSRYSTLALSCNQATLDYLYAHLNPMVWMNYSPKLDPLLKDDEYNIDESKLLEVDFE